VERGLVQSRDRGGQRPRYDVSLRILADIRGYRLKYLRGRCSRGEVGGIHPSNADGPNPTALKSWRESEEESG